MHCRTIIVVETGLYNLTKVEAPALVHFGQDRTEQWLLVRLPEVNFIDDKHGKPVGILQHIGRRPIAAFGNSDGDLQMLQWTDAGKGPGFCLIVHHTDAMREWAYDRESHIGKLDMGLDEAAVNGWTIVSMKDDWKKVFAFEE